MKKSKIGKLHIGVVAIVVATVRCAWVANFYRIKPELSNLPTTEKRFVNRKKFF